MRTTQRLIVAAGALVAAFALALAGASAAVAHVTVSSSNAVSGGWATLTFSVPVESATANTTELAVQLPASTPFSSVLARPVPGWTATLTSTKLAKPLKDDDGNAITSAVTRVTWTATDGGLKPGEFGQFALSVGPLPAPGTLYLPAVQTYSDGTTVEWSQRAQGGAEPEHPAPSVVVVAASSAEATTTAQPKAAAADLSVSAATSSTSAGGWLIALAIAALVVALASSGIAAAALARSRR
ncbi:YcnI family protein [Rathayibacter sp. CAU 1779]